MKVQTLSDSKLRVPSFFQPLKHEPIHASQKQWIPALQLEDVSFSLVLPFSSSLHLELKHHIITPKLNLSLAKW